MTDIPTRDQVSEHLFSIYNAGVKSCASTYKGKMNESVNYAGKATGLILEALNVFDAQVERVAWLEAIVVDHVERIRLFKDAMIDAEFNDAATWALVLNHEGHIETLNKRIKYLEEHKHYDRSEQDKYT